MEILRAGESKSGIPVVLPAAGLGTRMLPVTGGRPKELLRVGGTTLIGLAVEEALLSGLGDITLIIRPSKEALLDEAMEVLENMVEITALSPRLSYFYQGHPPGLGAALAEFSEKNQGRSFAVILPDNAWFSGPPPLAQMRDAHLLTGMSILGLIQVDRRSAPFFGNVGLVKSVKIDGKLHRIEKLGGKGKGSLDLGGRSSALRGFPRLILNSDFLSYYRTMEPYFESAMEVDDVPILQEMALRDRLMGYQLEGTGFDAGSPKGYRKVLELFESSGGP
jgi:UTP--glucose-1-phosphate uridylyltransferase